MGQYRKERMESVIKELLANEIAKTIECEDGLITVLGVSISSDFQTARIGVGVYPDAIKKESLKKLEKQKGVLAWALVKKMKIKKIPELVFALGLKKS